MPLQSMENQGRPPDYLPDAPLLNAPVENQGRSGIFPNRRRSLLPKALSDVGVKSAARRQKRREKAERLEIASRMFGSARRMLMNHLRSVHPDWDDSHIEREAARRLSHGAV